jgi:hypothetical protein
MTIIGFICENCKYFYDHEPRVPCPAFPKGIPDEIIGENDHSKVIPGQVGDYIFTPMKKND